MAYQWEEIRDRLYALAREGMTAPGAVELALEGLENGHWEVRLEAVHALGKLGVHPEYARKVAALSGDEQQVVRQVVARALGQLGDESVMACLEGLLNDPHPVVRKRAAEAIAQIWARDEAEQT